MKEQKLTLRHLSGYLPYGLKMVNTKSGKIIDVRGLRDTVTTFVIEATIKNGSEIVDVEYQADLWSFKPLLIPLSELTEEQWVDVFKAGIHNVEIDEYQYTIEIDEHCANLSIDDNNRISFNFWQLYFTSDIRFNQRAAFEKLYELHADLENLIESGLALNKNTNGK